jgi:hypothetical protein
VIRALVFFFLIGVHGHLLAQRSKPKWDKHPVITIVSGDSVFLFNTEEKKGFQPSSEKMYYWFNNGSIGSAQGGVTGKLLRGHFTIKRKGQGLVEKGKFDAGLKTGWWLRWYRNGSMQSKVLWKTGFKEGVFYTYGLEGNLKEKGYYKNNLLHGVLFVYGEDSQVTQTRYYKGKLVPPKNNQESAFKKTKSKKKVKAQMEKKIEKVNENTRVDSLMSPSIPEKKVEIIIKDVEKKGLSIDSIATPTVNEPKKKGRIPLSERIRKKQ